jgi:16S rRNA (cytosine967-C5)-methyltransferase
MPVEPSHRADAGTAELARAVARGGALADLLLELWRTTRIDWSFATDRLASAFRARRELGSRDRRFAAETLYGMIRHARRIDEALAAGGLRAASAAPDRERLLAYLVLEGELPVEAAASAAPAVDWRAVAAIDERIAREPDRVRRLALRRSLPDWLAARLAAEYGDDADALAAALNERAPMTIRANTLRTERDALAAALEGEGLRVRAGELASHALHVETRTNLFGLDAFRKGWFEAQDEGSQLVAEVVAPPPRGLVVDACAGAGGKTLALAALMGNRGRLLAADVDARKLGELKRRARRAGVTTAQAITVDAADIHPDAPWPPPLARAVGRADRVLVDAPCTGIGSLRRNPEARWRLAPADLERLPVVQRAIIERALPLVAPGGRLIYATCTLLAAENERVVEAVLAAHPELEPVPIKEIWGKERAAAVGAGDGAHMKLLPHVHGTDGFFAAVVRRRDGKTA